MLRPGATDAQSHGINQYLPPAPACPIALLPPPPLPPTWTGTGKGGEGNVGPPPKVIINSMTGAQGGGGLVGVGVGDD